MITSENNNVSLSVHLFRASSSPGIGIFCFLFFLFLVRVEAPSLRVGTLAPKLSIAEAAAVAMDEAENDTGDASFILGEAWRAAFSDSDKIRNNKSCK